MKQNYDPIKQMSLIDYFILKEALKNKISCIIEYHDQINDSAGFNIIKHTALGKIAFDSGFSEKLDCNVNSSFFPDHEVANFSLYAFNQKELEEFVLFIQAQIRRSLLLSWQSQPG